MCPKFVPYVHSYTFFSTSLKGPSRSMRSRLFPGMSSLEQSILLPSGELALGKCILFLLDAVCWGANWMSVTHSSMFLVFVCTHELHVRQWWEDTGFVQSLEVLKKSSHLPSNFPDLEKVWKMEIKSGKMLFFKATASALHFISEIFVVLVKSYSIWPVRLQRIMKWKALFLRVFF